MKNGSKCLLVILLIVIFIGTVTIAQAETTLQFVNWASAEKVTRENIEKVIKAFEVENPGIKVENIAIPFGQIRQQVVTMVAGGNAPDVIQLAANMPFELAAMDSLEPLEKYITDVYLQDNWQAAIEGGMCDGKLYAVPWGINYMGFWYNKKLMKEAGLDPNKPPKTWDGFMAALDKVFDNLSDSVDAFELFTAKAQYAATHNWSLFWAFNAFPLENETICVDTPEMKNYFKWIRSMIQEGYTTGGYKLREFREEFAKDRLVFGYDGPYMKGMIKSFNPDMTEEEFNEKYGVTNLPKGVHGKSFTYVDLHQLAMTKQSQNKQAAWKFIKYLVSSDIAIKEYIYPLGAIPPLKSTVNETHKQLFDNPVTDAYINEIISTGRPIPYGPKWGQAAQFISDAIQEAALTGKSIDEITADLEKQLSDIYSW